MTPEVSDFVPGSLVDTDKYIEVADGHHVTAKQKGQVQIKMCDDNKKDIHCKITQCTFSTRLMRQVIFDYYVNECRTSLCFSQGVLQGILQSKGERYNNITTQCTKEICISRKNHGKFKEKQMTRKKENCFRITTSEIRA